MVREVNAKRISLRRLAILLLLSAKDDTGQPKQPIIGTTRMQKLVFLVSEKVKGVLQASAFFRFDFAYESEKFGPADLDLYQDLDFLKTMQLINFGTSKKYILTAEPNVNLMTEDNNTQFIPQSPEEKEEDELSFQYLIGADPMELLFADAEAEGEIEYSITMDGSALIDGLSSQLEGKQKEQLQLLQKTCDEIRQQIGHWELRPLLKYVYKHYPDYTKESIIRDKINR